MTSPTITPRASGVFAPLATAEAERERKHSRIRLRAAAISLIVGLILMVAKFQAYLLTGSSAVLSDALESIVNVVAAGFAALVLSFGARPADRNHPYGHGKAEFISAAFEGGLIALAAMLIVYQALHALRHGPELRALDLGLGVVFCAGLVNAVLGTYLLRTGRRLRSIALEADGKHVLSDFWTSVGVVIGLLAVKGTGWLWLDPILAILVALKLAWTGVLLVRHAAGGLLDEEEPQVLNRLVAAMEESQMPGIIRVHSVRVIRSGSFHHVDAHVVVPEFWSVVRAHDLADEFERRVIASSRLWGEMSLHADPCLRDYCKVCELAECPVRGEEFQQRPALTVEEAVHPDPPVPPRL